MYIVYCMDGVAVTLGERTDGQAPIGSGVRYIRLLGTLTVQTRPAETLNQVLFVPHLF